MTEIDHAAERLADLDWVTERRDPTRADLDPLPTAGVVDAIVTADAAVAAAVAAVADDIVALTDAMVETLHRGGTVHYVGAGTSGRMGVLDAVELLPTFDVGPDLVRAHLAGGIPAMTRAVEGAEDDTDAGAALAADMTADDLVVGLAASGRTPFVGGALTAARA